jgi:hypothetical protein
VKHGNSFEYPADWGMGAGINLNADDVSDEEYCICRGKRIEERRSHPETPLIAGLLGKTKRIQRCRLSTRIDSFRFSLI